MQQASRKREAFSFGAHMYSPWKLWKGEDVGGRYAPVTLYLIAYYDGYLYRSVFPCAYHNDGQWRIIDGRDKEGDYLSLLKVNGTNKGEKVPMYDPSRGDQLFYMDLLTPDNYPLSPAIFRKLPAKGGCYAHKLMSRMLCR